MKIPILNYFSETLKEYLGAWDGTQKELAAATGILPSHISEMKTGIRRCTPEYDLRLSRFFSIAPGYFLRLQTRWDIERTADEKAEEINRTVQPMHDA